MKKAMKKVEKKQVKIRKTHPKIVITSIAALIFVGLSFLWPWFILVAVLLWWLNRKEIKKHFDA